MAKTLRFLSSLSMLSIALLTTSCGKSVTKTQVLMGNLSYNRGNYQKAILNYLDAEQSDIPTHDAVNYNLGNVYYALGEGRAALGAWERAESEADNIDTLFRIAFNKGLLFYHWGRYQEAYLSFKQALKLNPGNLDAKINLEESLSRIPASGNAPSSIEAPTDPEKGYSRILEYIKHKEASQWQQQNTNTKESLNDW